jgi:hypothetical protein
MYWLLYGAAAAILVAVFTAASMLPIPELFKGFLNAAGVGAVFSFLGQLWRDQSEYYRRRALQVNQQDFTLGIASHMANTAYTKHFQFAEAYGKKLAEGLRQFSKRGPSDAYAMELAGALSDIRFEYAVWLSAETEQRFFDYEKELGKLADNIVNKRDQPEKTVQEAVEQDITNPFLLITGRTLPTSEAEAQKSVIRVIKDLRKLLRIAELTTLRDTAITEAKRRSPGSEGL